MTNEVKKMQDSTPTEIRCSKCQEIILQAKEALKYAQKVINKYIHEHKCQKGK